ncbi:MAG: amidohydrolase [Chloroflexota bacterium]|nr:MAG: amidohydrolase [Chloroflexota bacterium]
MVSTSVASLRNVAEQVVLDRRHLHVHPELGFQERQTSRFIADRLRALGIETRTGIAETGVVGIIRGGRPGKTVLLRADIDALPIEEENDVPYRSTVPGVMHACGHDGHTAILLGTAQVLSERRANLRGNVVLAFQPCEEKPPGGAQAMIAQGVMDDPKVDAVFGLHLSQELPVGTVAARPGPIMAAADMFRLEIAGKGGHAARPHECVDAGLVAAQVMVALHALVAREVNPLDPAVITIGMIQAGTAPNIIPDRALLRGTTRTFDTELRERLARRIEEVATSVAAAMRATCVCTYEWGYPSVVNEAVSTAFVADIARSVVGEARLVERDQSMGGEDFAYFLQRAPGCFFNVGTRNEDRGLVWGHHHPRFDIDEAALPVGVEMFTRIVESYLRG